jgi:hypothetical protein
MFQIHRHEETEYKQIWIIPDDVEAKDESQHIPMEYKTFLEAVDHCKSLAALNGQQIFIIWDSENKWYLPYLFTDDSCYVNAVRVHMGVPIHE